MPLLLPGQRVQVMARLKRPIGLRGLGTANRRYQVMAHGDSLVASAPAMDVKVVSSELSAWGPPMRVHQWAVNQIEDQEGSADGRGIIAALATGERSLMSDPLLSAVRASGLAHLLAVSGMHMAAVVALIYFVVLRLWCYTPCCLWVEPKAMAAGVALLGAVFFAALTGARPSTCRALVVAALLLVAVMLDRRIRLVPALAWAGSVLLLWRPVLLWDVGFQMSFAATIALSLAFSSNLEVLHFHVPGRLERFARGTWSLVRASFWATFATAPIALYHFGTVSGLALLSNLLAVPLVTLILLPASLLGLFLSAIWAPLGTLVLAPCITTAGWLAGLCYQLETLVPVRTQAPLSFWELGLWALAGALLLGGHVPKESRWHLRKGLRWFALMAVVALLLLARAVGAQAPSAVRITFVEIGQGDAAIVELPGGQVWLVDGGGLPFVAPASHGDAQTLAESPARMALLPYLRHRRIDHIDLAIVSHPHPDHFVGLQAVAKAMAIREVWSVHESRVPQGAYERWLGELRLEGTIIRAPPVGVARQIGETSLEVLWPVYSKSQPPGRSRSAQRDPIHSVNDNSLVVRLRVGERRVLFAGDIEAEAEELLLARYGRDLRSDVVKVPHHGSRTSSTERFVSVTRPAIAIISCGRANRFEFPAPEVEERWQRHSRQLLRTDRVGSVTIEIDARGRMDVHTVDGF